jgi:hypothetical protein
MDRLEDRSSTSLSPITAIPDVENLESIQLSKTIYFDAWSRDKFMETLNRVIDALDLSQFIFISFSQDMSKRRK